MKRSVLALMVALVCAAWCDVSMAGTGFDGRGAVSIRRGQQFRSFSRFRAPVQFRAAYRSPFVFAPAFRAPAFRSYVAPLAVQTYAAPLALGVGGCYGGAEAVQFLDDGYGCGSVGALRIGRLNGRRY